MIKHMCTVFLIGMKNIWSVNQLWWTGGGDALFWEFSCLLVTFCCKPAKSLAVWQLRRSSQSLLGWFTNNLRLLGKKDTWPKWNE